MTAATDPALAALAGLLEQAAQGDQGAFMRFYDRTSGYVFALALSRAHGHGYAGAPAREIAARETCRCFVRAWTRAADHPASGLSPLAWLLTLAPTSAWEAACA